MDLADAKATLARAGYAVKVATPGLEPSVLRPPKVFVVYGHDKGARTELEAMLRRWGLDPLTLPHPVG